jgi:hypothetical protein
MNRYSISMSSRLNGQNTLRERPLEKSPRSWLPFTRVETTDVVQRRPRRSLPHSHNPLVEDALKPLAY